MAEHFAYRPRSRSLAHWWAAKINSFYRNLSVQDLASRLPLISRISRKEGEQIFQLMTGFVDTQILLTFVRTGALECLYEKPRAVDELGQLIGFDSEATLLLCRAGVALRLIKLRGNKVTLARRGALILGLPGILELIDHHSILYQDLIDPKAFFNGDAPRKLAAFWPYVFGTPDAVNDNDVARYSDLMTKSQFMVARDTLRAIAAPNAARWLDVGGGSGAFMDQVVHKFPKVQTAVFDLAGTQSTKPAKHHFIEGSFFDDDLPTGYDIISLIRVLYDHNDETVKKLLIKVYTALPENGRLIISEPMLGRRRPNRFGDTYFAIYTMAMNTGKTRSPNEIRDILDHIGFSEININASFRPFVTTVIEAIKK
jgi:demethylspheroidene O-methyltransferase